MTNHFNVATAEFNNMTFEQQCEVLDAQRFNKVKLTQEQIDAHFEHASAVAKATSYFEAMTKRFQLGVAA
jgi:hypothetical protein